MKHYGENSMFKNPLTRRKRNILLATMKNFLWSQFSSASMSQQITITEMQVKRSFRKMINRSLICDVVIFIPDYNAVILSGFEITKLELKMMFGKDTLHGYLKMRGSDYIHHGSVEAYWQ